MQEYDAILKRGLMRFSRTASALVTGFEPRRWLNVELPDVRTPRVDLLGETEDGRLFHIELQSGNDPDMALRMLDYGVAIYRQHRRRPEQLVLYAGEAPLRMSGRLAEFGFECRIADIREIDAEPLLGSPVLADNIVSILLRHPEGEQGRRAAVRRILERIGSAEPSARAEALLEVLVLAGLRKLAPIVGEEAERMPLLNDIMDHEVLGPKLRAARQGGEREVITWLAERRFGGLPVWAQRRLEAMTIEELKITALRLLDAHSIEELFR